jgi:iron complex transport system substrate-binding protein
MKHKIRTRLLLLLPLLLPLLPLLTACHSSNQKGEQGFETYYQPSQAAGFYLAKKGDHKQLHVFNPWQGAKDMELVYHLYPRNNPPETPLPNYIPIPVQRAICLSTTHIAYIDCLEQTATVVGVSGIGYVTNPVVQARYKSGEVQDVGFENLLSYETVVSLNPDVVFAYGINGEMTAVTDKLNKMGVRVVYLADYLEENLLGKAEYMVAMAAFFNKEAAAMERFASLSAEYAALAAQVAEETAHRPSVIMNAPWRDTWYMPGERNYMPQLIRDAGAKAIGIREGRNSAPLSLEAAYTYAMQADYWLHPNHYRTLDALQQADSRFANTPAFKNRKVYNNTLRATPAGGSDFWESGVVNPQVVLQDLVHIFHPEILPQHVPVYYERLP